MGNYIPDLNRFQLSGPPKWWLTKLALFDDSLYVLPSRQGFYYRLAQKRPIRLQEKLAADALKNQDDTGMLMSYGLVPVTTILSTANWNNPALFEFLHNMAPHRHGGADAFEGKILEQERDEEAKKAAELDDILTQVSKDGWGLYQKLIGVRSHMWIPQTQRKTVWSSNSGLK